MDARTTFGELDQLLSELIAIFSAFDGEQVNEIPFPYSWTPGQVVQHIVLSDEGFLKQLQGPVRDTARPAEQFVPQLSAAFLNFDIKMNSPDFIYPAAVEYQRNVLLDNLADLKKGFAAFDRNADMSKTCILFELPVLGFLTRSEILHFAVFHTKRHLHQLDKIRKAKGIHPLNYSGQ